MATILDAEFGSDDEDSDYVLSEASSDSEDDEKSDRKLKREEKKRKEREKLLQKVNDMFTDMLKRSDVSYKHPESRDKDDFMLQFHKKAPPDSKISNVKQFESYLDKSSSRVFKENLQLDISDFKSKCHKTPNTEKLEMIKNAVSVKDAEPVTVKTTYKFAGTTYEVMDKVDKTSRKYSNYLKQKEKELGGNFSFLDEMYSKLGPAPTLSAVSKSGLDWNKYKDDHNLESSLKRNYHHLKEQAFLERATWNEYERQLRARRQQ
ncbi:cytochrome c oxidase copper chaperone, Dopuin [Theileria orientalis]|uniref:Cytochrome c oxidase copper chaperone, Dopuin n=1 Tax=Theileria orientalis TaxID=68886 RepID=A0A976M526_THEOR|nr:cytochrome c oxidase copper chaperone, Dopuin [Theileria orientalis]